MIRVSCPNTDNHRVKIKMVKILGKYYLKNMTPEESKQWVKTNTGVKPEIRTDDQMVEFGLKLKSLEGKRFDGSSVHLYYFPSLNEDEAAFMFIGHHTYQDGIS